MAKVHTFLYCSNVERIPVVNSKEAILNANNISNNFVLEFIPSTYSFSILCILNDISVENDKTIAIKFKNSAGTVLTDTGNVPLSQLNYVPDVRLPEKYRGFTLSMDMQNVIIKEPGEYTTEVWINDSPIGDYKVYIGAKNES